MRAGKGSNLMKKKALRRAFAFALALCLLAACPPAYADGPAMGNVQADFTDVPDDAWYADYVNLCASWGIIDGKTESTYCPDDDLTRGEFIKLLTMIGELAPYTMDTSVHWSQPYWQVVNDNGVLWGLDIPCTGSALNAPITRYEMSVMISNLTSNVYTQRSTDLSDPELRISDYSSIAGKYASSVLQAYGKGILDGFEDGSFRGDETLSRAQAAAVVVRTGWTAERLEVEDVSEVVLPEDPAEPADPENPGESGALDPADSFANRAQAGGMIDAWGKPNAEACEILFGSSGKSYFNGSESNLSDYIVTVQVRTWDINSSGAKYTRTWNLEVNKAVADEVKAIFEEIYNDPEQFPIHALGGARYTDTLRHSWGCAIDINPAENFQCYTNTEPYTAITGTTCYKYSTSPYCITPGSSVVRAFAKYGWGWGGGTAENNYSGWTTTADYMHFSVLASGG